MDVTLEYYELLGVEQTATRDEIKKAYRALALRYHPDINSDEEAEEHIKKLNQAYSVLADPARRLFYDRNGVAPDRQSQRQARSAGPAFGGCRGRGRGMGCGRMWVWQEILRKR